MLGDAAVLDVVVPIAPGWRSARPILFLSIFIFLSSHTPVATRLIMRVVVGFDDDRESRGVMMDLVYEGFCERKEDL